MIKKFILSFLFLSFFVLSSCNKKEEEEYRTVPVTNNPLIVPDSGGVLPGFPSSSATPR